MQNQKCVCVHQFTKIYGFGTKQKWVCSNIDFCAQEGSITGLLGINGAGKTTLLKAIAAIHYATSGSISVCGYTDSVDIRNRTAFVPEVPLLPTHSTVLELLSQEAFLRGLSGKEKTERLRFAITSTELEPVLHKNIAHLSKGFLQRTSLAKALLANPDVLILDEFSSGLDPAQVVSIRSLLTNLAKKKIIILSTHNIQEAALLCKQIYILHKGTVVAFGEIPHILSLAHAKNLEDAFLKLSKMSLQDSKHETL